MPTWAHDRFFAEQRERDRDRHRLEHDDHAEVVHELEFADRIAHQGSLPPGRPLARAAARHRLSRGPSPTERPHEGEPHRFAAGERVRHGGSDDRRPGCVVRAADHEGPVVVDFGRQGTTLVAADELERAAA